MTDITTTAGESKGPTERPVRVIVTRPQPEADAWVQRLSDAGWHALALPLLDIQQAGDPEQLQAAWQRLADHRAVMFVSGAAVQHFFSGRPEDTLWPEGLRAWCTGPGSRAALLAQGVPAACIDVPAADALQLDSESLWAVVHAQVSPRDKVLLVRGQDAEGEVAGRTWLADRLQEAGGCIETLAVYRRGMPQWTPPMVVAARQSLTSDAVWLFSSSQAAGHLPLLLGPLAVAPSARALATHPRIAQAVRQLGFSRVYPCRPDLPSVLAFLESGA